MTFDKEPPMPKLIPLHCVACGAHWVGPSTKLGSTCTHIPRPAGAVDVFQDNPSSTEEAF